MWPEMGNSFISADFKLTGTGRKRFRGVMKAKINK